MQATKVRLGNHGRLVIPASYSKALSLEPGTELLRVAFDALRLMSRDAAIKRAQDIVRQYVPEGHSLVDELSAERRADGHA